LNVTVRCHPLKLVYSPELENGASLKTYCWARFDDVVAIFIREPAVTYPRGPPPESEREDTDRHKLKSNLGLQVERIYTKLY